MNLFRIFHRNPARDLANIGHAQRRQSVKETARRIREELGLEPDWRLG